MSLTTDDKKWIVGAITEALDTIVMPQFDRIENEFKREISSVHSAVAHLQEDVDTMQEKLGRLDAIENDVHSIYEILAELQKAERKNTTDIRKLRKDFDIKFNAVETKVHKLAAANGITL